MDGNASATYAIGDDARIAGGNSSSQKLIKKYN
jgi:hypothetical protein